MNKKSLSERDICTKFITPAIASAGWDVQRQVREEVTFTKGRVIVRGKLHTRGEARRADYVPYHQANRPIAVIEAKDNNHQPGEGMQQALDYAEALDVPPAEERAEILAVVREVLGLCSLLRSRIAAARSKPAHMADALVAEAVA